MVHNARKIALNAIWSPSAQIKFRQPENAISNSLSTLSLKMGIVVVMVVVETLKAHCSRYIW